MNKHEQQLLKSMPIGTVLFQSFVKGHHEDDFMVPFGVVAGSGMFIGFVVMIEGNRFDRMEINDDEIEYSFPTVTAIYKNGWLGVDLKQFNSNRVFVFAGRQEGYDSYFGQQDDKILAMDEIVKLTLAQAMKAYFQGRPKSYDQLRLF